MGVYWLLYETDEGCFSEFVGDNINEANNRAAALMLEVGVCVYVLEQLEVYNPEAA